MRKVSNLVRAMGIVGVLIATSVAGSGETGKTSPDDQSRCLDRSKQFAYTLPKGWNVVQVPLSPHDLIVLPSDDGKNRNIFISDQPDTNSLARLKELYERDLPKRLREFHLISSELIELESKKPAIRIIDTNTTPGVPVRQINYVLETGGRRYFIACTVLKDDGDKYDKAFEAFANSMAEPSSK